MISSRRDNLTNQQQQARMVEEKLRRFYQSPNRAARLTAFWLYLYTFGGVAAEARFGRRSYNRQFSELIKAQME